MNNIILCGFQYSGKTTLGKYLSEKLDKPFVDTDCLIAGMFFKKNDLQTARSLYHSMGEKNFRDMERDIIGGLQNTKNSVIATGGGSLLRPENRNSLKKIGKLIYLNWPFDVLKQRILSYGAGAYLDQKNIDQAFQDLYLMRHPIFLETAHMQIEMQNESIQESAEKILNLVKGKNYGE